MDFASRQAVFFDHATRYNREHATALTLQRAMLPTGLSYPSSIEVRHRYLPGSELVEVGGDWYESIRLPGARVALVVGDVAGHGVRAAVTMGRLRTAIQTLAMLELPPAASRCSSSTSSCRTSASASRTSRPAPTRSTTRSPARSSSRWRATCRRCSFSRTAPTSTLRSRRPRRSASSTTASWRPPGSRSRTGRCSCSTPTAWWSPATGTSARAWSGCRSRSARARRRRTWKTCARPPSTASTPTPSATTSRCSSPSCGASRRTTGSASRSSPSSPRVRQARAMVRDPLKRWGLEDLIPATELLVSELVTNAYQVRQGRDPAAAHPRAGLAGLRGARHLARAAPGAAGRQGRGERPRPARRLPARRPLGRPPHAAGQGRLVRAAGPGGDRGGDAHRDGDRAPVSHRQRSQAVAASTRDGRHAKQRFSSISRI